MIVADELAKRLLGGCAPYSDPPHGWVPWRKPPQPVAIDEAIVALTNRARAPRMRGRAELEDDVGIRCPFWFGRSTVVAAVLDAQVARTILSQGQPSTAAAVVLKRDRRVLADMADHLDTLRAIVGRLRWAMGSGVIERAVEFDRRRHVDPRVSSRENTNPVAAEPVDLDALEATTLTLTETVERARAALRRPIDPEAAAFLSRIAADFTILTGRRAAIGDGPFVPLVEAAALDAKVTADWHGIGRKMLLQSRKATVG